MELLVVLTILFVLMGIVLAVWVQAKSGQAAQQTRSLIARLDAIISEQYGSYANRYASGATPMSRAAAIRRSVNGDMPDRWTDVQFMVANPNQFTSGPQRAYIAIWNALPGAGITPSNTYAGAECLFMIVMQGGIANCVDCGALRNVEKGDKDGDGCPEFWDGWGNPIGFILWPAALKLPAGSTSNFFSASPPFVGDSTGRSMRPLIYSAGPDGEYGFERNNETANLVAGQPCGDPSTAPTSSSAGPLAGCKDNITNFDAEVAP